MAKCILYQIVFVLHIHVVKAIFNFLVKQKQSTSPFLVLLAL